jgi:hypothetical protein
MKVIHLMGFCLILMLAACGGDNSQGVETKTNDVVKVDESKKERIKNMYYLIPSPIETMMLLQKAGAEYDAEILNSPMNVSNYETEFSKAINLGVYGSDLSFSTMFDQSQETMFFLTTAKKLAESLGIMEAFSQSTLDRIEANIDDRDSLMHLISDSYWIVDSYLKENENITVSGLIIFGGWIEGLHIAAKLAENNPDNLELRSRITEQKYSLNNLIQLIDEYENPDLKDITTDLRVLKDIFDQAEISNEATSTKVNEGVTTIGGKKSINISDEQMAMIFENVHKIRSKYVEP